MVLLNVLERSLVSQRLGTLKGGGGDTLALQWWLEVGITMRERPTGRGLWAFCLVGNPPSKLSHFSIALKGNAPLVAKRALLMCELVDM